MNDKNDKNDKTEEPKKPHPGRFQKGNKAAVGRKNKTPLNHEVKKLLMANSTEILQKAIDLALNGDQSMIALLVNKILPQSTLIQQQLSEQIALLEEANNNDNSE